MLDGKSASSVELLQSVIGRTKATDDKVKAYLDF